MNKTLPKGNLVYMRRLNKIKILNLIRERKSISRAEISKVTGLSPPTVTRAVDRLIKDEKLAVEVGEGKPNGGRPPILIKFNSAQNHVIGIDLGTIQIHGVITNLNAEFISEIKIPTEVESGPEGVLMRVSNVIADLINTSGVDKSRIFGIGMAVAGLIDRQRKIVRYSPDFDWHEVDIISSLNGRFNIPVIFDNVTRVMALGELWYGIGKKYNNFICINVGHGIGSGIVIDGKALYGTEGMAGEFGHFTLDKDSEIQCKCGNYGCLEALSSGRGIAVAAQNELMKGQKSILLDMCSNNISTVTAEMVANAAKKGDQLASKVFGQAMEYLGVGIAGMINVFNPEAVVIGGGVSQAGDIFFERIKECVRQKVMYKHAKRAVILPATFGMNTTVMGAVSLILNEVLNLKLSKNA